MMQALDISLRFAEIALLLVITARSLWKARLTSPGVTTALFALSVAAYMLCSSRTLFPALGPFRYLVLMGCAGLPFFFWWFARALFDDAFRPRLWHGVFLMLFLALGQWVASGPHVQNELANAGFLVTHHVIALGLVFFALFEALKNYNCDLLESRRQIRLIIVTGAGVYILMVVSVELVFGLTRAPAWLETMNVAGIVLLSLFLAPKLNRDLIANRDAQALTAPDIAPADQLLMQALLRAMRQDKIYRREGLTIGELAKHLSAPEHLLRRLINRHLGYRNFNAFLNHYRVEEARAQLGDIALARIPVLTIAMDLGYRSLSPFNKAFKEITGVTPTEYRRARLGRNHLTDSEKTASIPESA